MSKRKLLLTGATGMLGKHIFSLVSGLPQFEVYPVGKSSPGKFKNFVVSDITDLVHFESIVDSLKPEYVIHCAANVNVNACQQDQERTYNLHVGTSSILASKSFISKNIYVSTDSVFDGKKGNYLLSDGKNPLNVYAQTKSFGEDMFLKSTQNSVIIRTNIIGFNIPLKNSLFEWIYLSLKEEKPINGFSNIFFNPLYVKTLAQLMVDSFLLGESENGIYHFGSSNYLSKYDFAKLVALTFGFNDSLIHPINADDHINGVSRPLNTTLNIEETQKKLRIEFPSLEQELVNISNDLKYAKRI